MIKYIINNILDILNGTNPRDGIFKNEINNTNDDIYYNIFFNEWRYR